MTRLSSTDLTLLVLLTVAWGLNWPVMKFGVAQLPPLYFRVICICGGLLVLYAYARAADIDLAVPRKDWKDVLRLAIPNAIAWHVLVIVALTLLPAGRTAILGYTMPVWAVIFGPIFGERPQRRHLIGVAAAFVGTLLLLSSEFTALAGKPLGTVLMLSAAAAWGYGTHLTRRHATGLPVIALTFWMLVAALAVMVVGTVVFESQAWRAPTSLEWGAIVYNMVLAIAFCHVVWTRLARTLPPAMSGLSVMMIPVLGVFSSMLLLDEVPQWQDYAALALILFALMTVLLVPRRSG